MNGHYPRFLFITIMDSGVFVVVETKFQVYLIRIYVFYMAMIC